MASFEGMNCPIFIEATDYYMQNNPFINETMSRHEGTVKKWVKERLNIS